MPNFAAVIEEAMPVMRAAAKLRGGSCSVMHRLTGESVISKPGELNKISEFLQSKGFKEFEYLGSGSHAVAVAPTDNPNVVVRLMEHCMEHRSEIPYMLQPIGKPQHLCAVVENGRKLGGYDLEFLKRLDMDVAPEALKDFVENAKKLGYRADSLSGRSEVGWYRYKNLATRGERKVLMASDPSALSRGSAEGFPIGKDYPSLKEQFAENMKIARDDPRLSFLIPDIERQLSEAPVCRSSISDGWVR